MKVDFEKIKQLAEAGDTSAFVEHIYQSLEKGDILSAATKNADVRSELDSEKDKHASKAIDTWKENHLQKLIDEAVAKANPQETPEQKRIRELEEKIAAKDAAEKRAALKAQAFNYATEKGFDAKFANKWIEKFIGDDENVTNQTLDEFKADFDAFVQAQVEERLKSNARNVGGGLGGGGHADSYGKKIAQNFSDSASKAVDAQQHYFK